MSDPDLNPDTAYDIMPEDAGKVSSSDTVSGLSFKAEQDRLIEEQNNLRARCIENGEDAEKFLNSNFGQYLIGQAELCTEKAKEDLCSVDPDDKKTIIKLQNDIWRNRSLKSWIKDAIHLGDSEYNEYLQSREN